MPRFGFHTTSGDVLVFDHDRLRAGLYDQDVRLSLVALERASVFAERRPARVHAVEQGGDASVELVFYDGHGSVFGMVVGETLRGV